MEIISRSSGGHQFEEYWLMYLKSMPSSYRYLLGYLDYLKSQISGPVQDFSFVVVQNKKPLCIVPLVLTELNKEKTQFFLPSPLATNDEALTKAFEQISQILQDKTLGSLGFFIDPLSGQGQRWNFLKKFGFVECNEDTIQISLEPSKEELWRQLRKSYKALINSTLKNTDFSIHYFDSKNADFEAHESYRNLHHKCSGKVTRPLESFKAQYDLVAQRNGLIAGLKFKDQWVAFVYFLFKDDKAVYFSASDDPDLAHLGHIYHALLWSAFMKLKEMNISIVDLGTPSSWHQCQGFMDYSDSKQIGIAHFKRGLGGEMKTVFRGVKYFDKKVFSHDLSVFNQRFNESLESAKPIPLS